MAVPGKFLITLPAHFVTGTGTNGTGSSAAGAAPKTNNFPEETMSHLTRQSNKANKIQSVICLADGINHKTVTSCHSETEPVSYEQVIQPTGIEVVDGHKVVVYKVTCEKVTGHGLECCKGHKHTYTLCKHSIAGVRKAVERKGKKIYMMRTWENALKRKGQLVKLVGESGYTWGVVR